MRMSKRFSRGGYQPTEPQPEIKIDEVTYGDGVKTWQVLEYTLVGFVQTGRNFGSLKQARKHLDTRLSEKRARTVTRRERVYP